jgi:hypothetical protein
MEGHYEWLSQRVQDKDLICIQDTSEYMYSHQKGLRKEGELGRISHDYNVGIRVHPMLVLDAVDEFAYGFSSLEMINRDEHNQNKPEGFYKKLSIEEKESYRWIQAALHTKRLLQGAQSVTIVSDRESDIYQLWSRIPDERTHLVIRTCLNRIFKNEKDEKTDPAQSATRVGIMKLSVSVDSGKKRKAREADIELFVQKSWTRKPPGLKQKNEPDSIPLYMVVAKEIVHQPREVPDPIEWVLLTDIKTETFQDAIKIISIYKSRWNIEQIFRLTKHQGFQLERSQLETAHALENLIALVFIAAVKVFQMVKSRNDEHRPALDIFQKKEVKLLARINKGLEGRSKRSKNKNKPESAAFIIWIIARLGNWKPEDKDPPGPITLLRGWMVLQNYIKVYQFMSG